MLLPSFAVTSVCDQTATKYSPLSSLILHLGLTCGSGSSSDNSQAMISLFLGLNQAVTPTFAAPHKMQNTGSILVKSLNIDKYNSTAYWRAVQEFRKRNARSELFEVHCGGHCEHASMWGCGFVCWNHTEQQIKYLSFYVPVRHLTNKLLNSTNQAFNAGESTSVPLSPVLVHWFHWHLLNIVQLWCVGVASGITCEKV